MCEADKKGTFSPKPYPQRLLWQSLREECAKIKAQELIALGYQGQDIQIEMNKKELNVSANCSIRHEKNMKNNQNLVWIDLEMTGLNPEKDVIIEIATVVTDMHLNILGEGPVLAISQDLTLIQGMDEWNTRQHHQSGLVQRVLESTCGEKKLNSKPSNF